MTWLATIALALVALALGALAFRGARRAWTTMAAALMLGLAGYALQASPGVPAAPAAGIQAPEQAFWDTVEARKEMISAEERSPSDIVAMADGYSRKQRHADAAHLLRQVLARDPDDAEAWLALGNALVEHANGTLTLPAMTAYRRAEAAAPGTVGPGYFLGLSLIREGQLGEARAVWQATLESAEEEATGRAALVERLARLDTLLQNPAFGGPPAAQ